MNTGKKERCEMESPSVFLPPVVSPLLSASLNFPLVPSNVPAFPPQIPPLALADLSWLLSLATNKA